MRYTAGNQAGDNGLYRAPVTQEMTACIKQMYKYF